MTPLAAAADRLVPGRANAPARASTFADAPSNLGPVGCALRQAQIADADLCVSVRSLVQHGALLLENATFLQFSSALDRAFRSPHNSRECRDAEFDLQRALSDQPSLRNACYEALRYSPSSSQAAGDPVAAAGTPPLDAACWLTARRSPNVKRLRRRTPSYYKSSKTTTAQLKRATVGLGPSLVGSLSTSLVSAAPTASFAPRLRSPSEREREAVERTLWEFDVRVSRLSLLLDAFQPLMKRLEGLQLHPSRLAREDPSGSPLAHTMRHALCQELVFRNEDVRVLLNLYFPHGMVILRELYSRPWHAGPVIASRVRQELAVRRRERHVAVRRQMDPSWRSGDGSPRKAGNEGPHEAG